jgi:hypothetical protein
MHDLTMAPRHRRPLNEISVDGKNRGLRHRCAGNASRDASVEASTVGRVEQSHRAHVERLLRTAAADHTELITRLPPELKESLPVDAQGLTRAIDYLAAVAGLSEGERRALIRPHALNPAVLHARIFGPAPLARETVIASFVEGARVRADGLAALADAVGSESLGREVRSLLVASPPPVATAGGGPVAELRAAYAAQERAAVMIAERLDALEGAGE